MTSLPRQLALTLPHHPQMTRADWLTGLANAEAVALVDRFPDWPNRVVLLIGPAGSGKTHLARIWREEAAATEVAARDVNETAIESMLAGGPLLVEDLHAGGLDEAALFHLLNLARERGTHLLLTSALPPAALGLSVADLASRLRLALPVELAPPDDDLLLRVLVKLFADRQLRVDPGVSAFIVRRMERSFDAASRIVAALDQAALAAGKPVTRQLAAAVLEGEFGDEPDQPL